MKHIHYDTNGGVEVLTIKESPLPIKKLDHVLMKITHCAINRAEVLQRQGKVPVIAGQTAILGLEASGFVIDDNGAELYPAMGLFTGGSYSQYAQIHKDHIIELPKTLTLEQGAAIPEAWITAYQILKWIGRVNVNENVLIYAGASGVGTAAIQLAKYLGAHPIASSSSQEKLDKCKLLGAELCLNYKKNVNQAEDIMSFTNGKGVDIVLDCVGAQNYALTDKVLALDGRWIVYGTLGGQVFDQFNMGSLLRRRISLTTTLLKSRSDEYKTSLIQNFKKDILEGLSSHILNPVIDRVIKVSWEPEGVEEWKKAHRIMEEDQNVGKIVMAYQ